jgi:SpoIVB peptidase S55
VRTAWAVTAIITVCLGGAVSAGVAQTAEAPPIMPLDEVRPGMTGYGLTVLHGTTIERFSVTILGILRGGPASDLILFRASGPVILESGGTASGMSGSPIYVNGRAVGALSFGYHFAGPDSDLSLATPIEEMLKALAPAGAGIGTARPRLYQARVPVATPLGPVDQVIVMDSTADAALYNAGPLPRTVAVAPVALPVAASGLTPAALGVLSHTLRRFNVMPRQTYGGQKTFPTPPVEPGSSIGVELVRGDVEVGAIGTVTYRRGDQIVAFGHPFLNAGTVSVLLTSAWIDTVVRSLDFPFKEGSIGEIVGMATQDRAVGVGGVVGRFPRTFGVRVSVHDGDRGTTQALGVQVIRRRDLAEGLVPTAVLSLVQRIMDRVAGGSAKVKLALRARAVPRVIQREDLAFDAGDIATASVLDVPAATQLLFDNFFQEVDPIDMAVDVTVSSKPNTALLIGVRPSVRTVHPGDTVGVALRLRPSGATTTLGRVVEFTVPEDFPAGQAFLLVGSAGGLNAPAPPSQLFTQLVATLGSPPSVGSLDAAIEQFEHSGKNTEVLVELVPESVLVAAGSNANPGFDTQAGTSLPTEWVVLGRFQIPMVVK